MHRTLLTSGRDEEEEVRADAFVGAIDLFPAVAQQQQQQLLSEFKTVLGSCSEEASSSAAARAFNRCVVRYTGPLYVTLGRALYTDEADCAFFLSTIKRFACDFGPEVRALVAFNMPAFYTAFGPSKNTHLLGTLQRLLQDRETAVRLAAARTMGVISGMIGAEQRQGVFADAFLKLFDDSDEATLMAALASFEQAGPHFNGILPSLTARSICSALVGVISAKVRCIHVVQSTLCWRSSTSEFYAGACMAAAAGSGTGISSRVTMGNKPARVRRRAALPL
jgi:hypothetical protein